MPPPRRCYEPRNSLRLIAASIFREGSRPSGCPRPMRRGWLRRNRLNRTSGTFMGARRFSALCRFLPISMVKSRSGGLGYSNAKTARRAFQILRLLGPRGTPPKPPAKLRNSPGNSVRISGGNIVTRYSLRLRYNPMPEQLNQDHRADPLAFAYHFDCSEEQVFDCLSRYASRIQRDYSRCLKDLQTLQAARKKEIIQTNPKSKVTPAPPTPSGDSDPPEQPASPAPTPPRPRRMPKNNAHPI